MGWVRMDDRYRTHQKVIHISSDAIALDVCSMQFSSEFLTDGFIKTSELRSICASVKRPQKAAEELVSVGRWIVKDGGWQIHDYLEYNPCKQEVLEKRQRDKERKAQQRRSDNGAYSANFPRGHNEDVRLESVRSPQDVQPSPSPAPTPSPKSSEHGGQKPVENPLAERLDRACSGVNTMSESVAVIDICRKYVADQLIDEAIGLCESLDKPPKFPRYLLTMVPKRALRYGIQVPELRIKEPA